MYKSSVIVPQNDLLVALHYGKIHASGKLPFSLLLATKMNCLNKNNHPSILMENPVNCHSWALNFKLWLDNKQLAVSCLLNV